MRSRPVDYASAFLTRGLIAYIGNKRSLLPFLGSVFARCAEETGGDGPIGFADPFAGSGGVSRLARAMGFSVASNDRERYAALIGRCRVVLDPARLEAAFSDWGGSAAAFAALDAFARGERPEAAAAFLDAAPAVRRRALDAFAAADAAAPYIARHYAPRDTAAADWRGERLFYTAENGRFLDRAREAVELLFPGDPLDPGMAEGAADAKSAFLDAVLYQAATRVNTSGVFKACHRGFGGHGSDALGRILSPMRLSPPDLVDGPPARVGAEDAAAFCAKIRKERAPLGGTDIVYLDPPYNQHQYGSNYHLLTTIARWDKPPVPDERDESGFLLDRAGIRSDWKETRSDFCSRPRAAAAFRALLDAMDARFVLLSYNDGGILPLDELRAILEERGSVRVEAVPYVAYRGGKQSATRTERTSEFLFVLDGRGAPRPGSRDAGVDATLLRARALGELEALRKSRFDPRRRLPPEAAALGASVGADARLRLDTEQLSGRTLFGGPSVEELASLCASLRHLACGSNVAAFDLVLRLYLQAAKDKKSAAGRLGRDALHHLKKIAFRKYAAEFAPRAAAFRKAAAADEKLLSALGELEARASLRGVAQPMRAAQPMSDASSSTSAAKDRQAASTGSGPAMSTPATRSDSIG